MKWAQDFYWLMAVPHGKRKWRRKPVLAGLCFGPGLTLPFGFALVRFKPPFKDTPKPTAADKEGR